VTQQDALKGMRVAIIVANDFEQTEMTEPRKALDQSGAHTVLISPIRAEVQGFNHDVKADRFKVDLPIDHARPEDFDALLLPGGALNADFIRMDEKAREFVRSFDRSGKPMAVICHGPWLLVSSGVARGRTLTSYYTVQDDLRNAGANWVDQEVVHDGNLVTSRQPADIPAFNREMLQLFSQSMKNMRKAA
jgi:protease I